MGTGLLGEPFPPAYPVVVAEFAPPPLSDLVDSVEAADMLGTTLLNVRQMVFKKRLVPVGRQGRRNLFSREQVAALAAARRKEPDADE